MNPLLRIPAFLIVVLIKLIQRLKGEKPHDIDWG